MCPKFDIKPQGWLGRIADAVMVPLKYLASGTLRESPRRTIFWNHRVLTKLETERLLPEMMVKVEGIQGELDPSETPLAYIPACGGWRNYIILRPLVLPKSWHVGWVTGDTGRVSKVPLKGAVRMLVGPGDVQFFGIANGRQVTLLERGRGIIGKGGPYRKSIFL